MAHAVKKSLEKSTLVETVFMPIQFFFAVAGFPFFVLCCHSSFETNGLPIFLKNAYSKSKSNVSEQRLTSSCKRCKRKVFVSNLIVGAIGFLLTINALRYAFVFVDISDSPSMLVTAVSFQHFFTCTAAMYILTRWDLSRHFVKLVKHFQAFEATYGMSIDYSRVRKLFVFRSCMFLAFQFAFTFGFITFVLTIFPSLKIHLSPLHKVDGVVFYTMLILHALFMYIQGSFVFCNQAFLGCVTYILCTEFKEVSQSFRGLLSCHRGPSDKELRQPAIPVMTIKVSESKFKDCIIDVEDFTPDAVHGPRAQIQSGNKHKSMTHPSSSSEYLDGDDPLQMKDNGDSLSSTANAQVVETAVTASTATPDFEKMEKMFNEAVFKHMALCQIVKLANVCLRQIVGFSLLVTLLIIFLTLYTFINRDLDLGNMLFNIYNFLIALIFEVIGLGLGLVINESAHAPAAVIYSADWSRLPDRLLLKMQMFCNRLGQNKIGYDVYGLFVIERSTILMMIGTLVTYAVVVIQFQQSATCGSGGGGAAFNSSDS